MLLPMFLSYPSSPHDLDFKVLSIYAPHCTGRVSADQVAVVGRVRRPTSDFVSFLFLTWYSFKRITAYACKLSFFTTFNRSENKVSVNRTSHALITWSTYYIYILITTWLIIRVLTAVVTTCINYVNVLTDIHKRELSFFLKTLRLIFLLRKILSLNIIYEW